ncbi:MAG TPA: hypothetical protein VGF49_03210, partial [Candidatus Solibacter sp.]
AKVGLGTIGPVFKDLQTRKIIQFAPKGSAGVGDHRGLLDEWVTHYPITLRPKLTARRLEAEPQSLKGADLKPYHAFWGVKLRPTGSLTCFSPQPSPSTPLVLGRLWLQPTACALVPMEM